MGGLSVGGSSANIALSALTNYTPTLGSSTGATVAIVTQDQFQGYLRYMTLISGSNKFAVFSYAFQFLIGAGTNPAYITMTLPFTVQDSFAYSVPFVTSTSVGGTGRAGMTRNEAAANKTLWRLYPDFAQTATWTQGSNSNFVQGAGVAAID